MKNKELLKKLNYCTDILNVFDIYATCLDEYFDDDKNKEEHTDLYNYYKQLINNIMNVQERYKK